MRTSLVAAAVGAAALAVVLGLAAGAGRAAPPQSVARTLLAQAHGRLEAGFRQTAHTASLCGQVAGLVCTQVVVPLVDGCPARYQRWDWNTDTGAEWHDVPVGALLIVEGVSSTRADIPAPWDLTIWVDAPEELRLARALERDGPDMLATWLAVWLPEESAYVARERPQDRVDLIVPGYS